MTTVIFHSADYDGIFCREIARKFLPEDTTFIGWNYGDPPIPIPTEGDVYVMDLPTDKPFGWPMPLIYLLNHRRLVWIDHHASAIKSHPPDLVGYRIDGVAACRLAWQWFTINSVPQDQELPRKEKYLACEVDEPLAVQLAGEYDVWDRSDPRAETFQYGLRIQKDIAWDMLLSQNTGYTDALVKEGEIAQRYAQNVDASIVTTRSFIIEFEGLKFLALNTARCNSLAFAARDVPETGHDALMGFFFNGKEWIVSLYHARHRTDLDLSAIAVKYGGGGHRGACGFQALYPFWLPPANRILLGST